MYSMRLLLVQSIIAALKILLVLTIGALLVWGFDNSTNTINIFPTKEISQAAKIEELTNQLVSLKEDNKIILEMNNELQVEKNKLDDQNIQLLGDIAVLKADNEVLKEASIVLATELKHVQYKYDHALIKSGSVSELVTSQYKESKDAVKSWFKKGQS